MPECPANRHTRQPAVQAGVLVGMLTAVDAQGTPWVHYAGAPGAHGVAARTTVRLQSADIGRRVALMFEDADLAAPIVIGCMLPTPGAVDTAQSCPADAPGGSADGTLVLAAPKRLELRCGKASITLLADGCIEIRGTELLSRASAQNRIRGASIHLN